MSLLFPKVTLFRLTVLTLLLAFCWWGGGDPFATSADGLVYACPWAIVGAGAALGSLAGGSQLIGQHIARQQHKKSALGKAETAIAQEQTKIAKAPLKKLGLSEGQKRKAMTMALEQARSQKRQLEAQQARGKDYRGPARSGIEAIQDVQLRQGMMDAGAAARANIEAQSAQLALQRKQAAMGTVMPMAQAQAARFSEMAKMGAEAAAGGIYGGVAAGTGYAQGKASTTGTDATGTTGGQ